MNQLAIPFAKKSATSKEAARRISGHAARQRSLVYDYLMKHPDGLTDEEMQDGIPIAPSSQRPRRIELVRMGLVRDSGIQRLTKSDRFATVWRALSPEEAQRERLKKLAEHCRAMP